eukprot:TRINITY_DN40939_c0_g1_i1.p1 TRINITY_DN40939_c0_g1~~TRINITY_DN40939_c0_g1_i1.p1  ORF type:complete len:317 (+),score=20.73 TRINITY_DN40939_c0_g1_i1:31-951(+)
MSTWIGRMTLTSVFFCSLLIYFVHGVRFGKKQEAITPSSTLSTHVEDNMYSKLVEFTNYLKRDLSGMPPDEKFTLVRKWLHVFEKQSPLRPTEGSVAGAKDVADTFKGSVALRPEVGELSAPFLLSPTAFALYQKLLSVVSLPDSNSSAGKVERQVLFHGTKPPSSLLPFGTTSVLDVLDSIAENGFRFAGVHVLGNGVYFATRFEDAARYAHPCGAIVEVEVFGGDYGDIEAAFWSWTQPTGEFRIVREPIMIFPVKYTFADKSCPVPRDGFWKRMTRTTPNVQQSLNRVIPRDDQRNDAKIDKD